MDIGVDVKNFVGETVGSVIQGFAAFIGYNGVKAIITVLIKRGDVWFKANFNYVIREGDIRLKASS